MHKDYVRLPVELPPELKEEFRALCKKKLTDMSTRARQLIFDDVYARDMAPKGFLSEQHAEGEPIAAHRKRSAGNGRTRSNAKRGSA